MALLGPMVVVAENSAADLIDVLGKAGAFPIVETRWADAPAAIAEILPVALAIADPQGAPSPQHVGALMQCIETRGGPVTPVIALVENNSSPVIPSALPIALDDSHRPADCTPALRATHPYPACHRVAAVAHRGRKEASTGVRPARSAR